MVRLRAPKVSHFITFPLQIAVEYHVAFIGYILQIAQLYLVLNNLELPVRHIWITLLSLAKSFKLFIPIRQRVNLISQEYKLIASRFFRIIST